MSKTLRNHGAFASLIDLQFQPRVVARACSRSRIRRRSSCMQHVNTPYHYWKAFVLTYLLALDDLWIQLLAVLLYWISMPKKMSEWCLPQQIYNILCVITDRNLNYVFAGRLICRVVELCQIRVAQSLFGSYSFVWIKLQQLSKKICSLLTGVWK